jgi:hypothetical protein
MLYWHWFNRPRHPLLRLLLGVIGLVMLAGVLTVGFFALIAFAFIGAIVALTRALARSHVAAATAPQPHPAADHPRVIEGEFIVVDPAKAEPQH